MLHFLKSTRIIIGVCLISLTSCGSMPAEIPEMKIELSSKAFLDGGFIPVKYSCDGEEISPQLSWTGVPAETASIVLIVDDPDAPLGTFIHWVLFNIEPTQSSLPEGFSPDSGSPGINIEGKNGFGHDGYGPLCPPKGSMHRYYFQIFALDQMLDLPAGSTRQEVEKQMSGKILAAGQLVGKFGR
jgi:Raf kinase inhibitor-like YbhB/YbcL family protein